MDSTKQATVRFRCRAEATINYDSRSAGVLERLRRAFARRDCPACSGEPLSGLYLQDGPDGSTDVWAYQETTGQRAN